ncbi:MAG: ester cyclase [Sphingomonadales bacterium]
MTADQVTDVAASSLDQMLCPTPGRRMSMRGFDDEFVDIADYIVRITDRIWHQRHVEDCRKYYTQDAVIHTLAGDVRGVEAVVAGTHETLKSYPDRYLNPDNVIWSGNDADGFYSSHRLTSLMTNLGASVFGPATGKRLRVPAIADCLVRENRIVEEWLVRDNMGLARQLGVDIDKAVAAEVARGTDMAGALRARDRDAVAQIRASSHNLEAGPLAPNAEPAAFANAVLNCVWRQRDEGRLAGLYDHRARIVAPAGRNYYGTAEWSRGLSEILACLDDVCVRLDHVAAIPYLGAGLDIAARWSLAARHQGDGIYGPSTAADIWLLGISHWRVINGRVHDEWTLFDELALMTQIARARS